MYKLSIIGTVGVPACYGGFETLVDNILDEKSSNKYLVYAYSKAYENKVLSYKNADIKYLPINANGPSSVVYDILSLLHSTIFVRPENILVLGVSGAIALPFVKLLSSSNIITNIDGLEWKRDKWGKFAKRFLKFSEALAVKYSDVVISDNEAITEYVSNEYGVNSVTIAYGGDNSCINNEVADDDITEESYALSLCRIEPENNVHTILESFSILGDRLKFVGNWNSSDYGRNLKKQYSKFKNIQITDPVYDKLSVHNLRENCSYYVHGHSAGGTNPSLVEIMHYSKPIVAFDCKYNRATTEDTALYFSCSESLCSTLQKIGSKDFIGIGDSMREIAKRRYTWSKIKSQYESLLK